jgi:hypothetical protein
MNMPQHICVIGDIHGQFDKLVILLRNATLIDEDLLWCGSTATVWFLGDFFDRGPDGIAVVNLIMSLQQQALAVGGNIHSLLGNHEVALLAARRFGKQPAGGPGGTFGTFYSVWKYNGGHESDLEQLTPDHITWITNLPAMAHCGDRLLVHADSSFYINYGHSVEEVNQSFRQVLGGNDASEWDLLLDEFNRREFDESRLNGKETAQQFLQIFGGRQIVHGHTPIHLMSKQAPEEVNGPWIYAGGVCINVDGGMYLGGSGFVYELSFPHLEGGPEQTYQPQ